MSTVLNTATLPQPHEILSRVFNTPEKKRALARVNGIRVESVHRWLRDGGTGERSNLDRVVVEMTLAVREFGPEGRRAAGLVADYLREVFISLVEEDAEPYSDEHERVIDSAELMREANEALDAMLTGKPTPETLKELVELRDKCEAVITRLSIAK
jgi:hypothetical protein